MFASNRKVDNLTNEELIEELKSRIRDKDSKELVLFYRDHTEHNQESCASVHEDGPMEVVYHNGQRILEFEQHLQELTKKNL